MLPLKQQKRKIIFFSIIFCFKKGLKLTVYCFWFIFPGSILIDEIKLSEGLWLDKHSLKLMGLVFLDQFTPEAQKDVPADYALVIMFQGFEGQYFQSISAHLLRGAVKGLELSKLTLEATRLVEEAGFFVDTVVTDAAAWNRNMWAQFGIKKLKYEKEN